MWNVGHGTVFLFGTFLIIERHVEFLSPAHRSLIDFVTLWSFVTAKNVSANFQAPLRGIYCSYQDSWKWKWSRSVDSLFAQSLLTLCDPMGCSLPGFSVHVIFETRVLEWVAISFSRTHQDSWVKFNLSCTAHNLLLLSSLYLNFRNVEITSFQY